MDQKIYLPAKDNLAIIVRCLIWKRAGSKQKKKKSRIVTQGCFNVGVYNKHMLQKVTRFPEGQKQK